MPTVLITGVSKGIGRALAQKFLMEKYFVIGTFLSTPPDFSDKDLFAYKLDLSSSESISECSQVISNAGKKIDILINNAGVLLDEDETRVIVGKLRKTLEVNLIGAIDFTEHIINLYLFFGRIFRNGWSSPKSFSLSLSKLQNF